jgi:serine phosphatase RsbU (regulator of sigma subunit)/anti-sigma regulatory factor (Ser/Thr protein kinase)
MHTQRQFPPEGQSVARARRFVRQSLEESGAGDLADETVLAASELVTNAVVHAGTPVQVAVDVDARGVRLEVQDQHPNRALPLGVENPDVDAEHGRGLLIASVVARSWGVDYSAGAKRVWLRVERGEPPGLTSTPPRSREPTDVDTPGVATVELAADGRIVVWDAMAVRMFGWEPDEVVGRPVREFVERHDEGVGADGRPDVPDFAAQRWQGVCTVRRRHGAPARVFVSAVAQTSGEGASLIAVPLSRRSLLEWPAREHAAAAGEHDPLGLREDALNRLGVQAYLDLVVERARDRLSGRAAYLLLAHDVEGDFEVVTVSGLRAGLRGRRLASGTPGVSDAGNPRLPVSLTDLGDADVPWLAGSGVRALMVAPVVMEGRVVGGLGVGTDQVAGYTDEEGALLLQIANLVAPAADRARLRVSERERRGWLTFLAESGDFLAGSLDQTMTMAITGQIIVPRLATWCALSLDDVRGRPVLEQVWHRDERRVAELRQVLDEQPPDRFGDLLDDRLGEVANLPLLVRGARIGLLTLGRAPGDPLAGEARVVAESVARRAAMALDNARAHGELRAIGEALQRGLLPASIPTAPFFDVGVMYQAAGERTVAGGDFYDLFSVGSGRWCFAVGDVCGSGPEAAAVTGLARHTIRALAIAGFPVAPMLERLNTAILDEGERARFLTLVCGLLEPAPDGRVHVSMVSAGHPLPFVVRRGGETAQVGRPQPLLGVLEVVSFETDECLLGHGDLLVAVTDGVLERRNGDRMLEEAGLLADLAVADGLPAQAVAERIARLVGEFAPGPPADDMAVLAIRVASAATISADSPPSVG